MAVLCYNVVEVEKVFFDWSWSWPVVFSLAALRHAMNL
jgi:uncharacterized integral membrane protein